MRAENRERWKGERERERERESGKQGEMEGRERVCV
jgi:hypothetical protein